MRELPILFSTPMVQAILDDLKNMTRRLNNLEEINQEPDRWSFKGLHINQKGFLIADFYDNNGRARDIKCPWQPGDILYVRETWWRNYPHEYGQYWYRADGEEIEIPTVTGGTAVYGKADGLKWHPSIHMPKKAARIWLEVVNARVERLQDITEEDCYKEGIERGLYVLSPEKKGGAFHRLWDSTIKKKDLPLYGWDTNPWVWTISFKKVKP